MTLSRLGAQNAPIDLFIIARMSWGACSCCHELDLDCDALVGAFLNLRVDADSSSTAGLQTTRSSRCSCRLSEWQARPRLITMFLADGNKHDVGHTEHTLRTIRGPLFRLSLLCRAAKAPAAVAESWEDEVDKTLEDAPAPAPTAGPAAPVQIKQKHVSSAPRSCAACKSYVSQPIAPV